MSRIKVVLAGIAVLAVSAVTSSPAMAAGGWLIKGTLLVGITPLATTAFVDEGGILKFGSTEIRCISANFSGVSPQIESPNMVSATSLMFKECSVTSSGECELESGPTIGTLPVLAEVTLEGLLSIRGLIKPKAVTTLATIKLKGANCPETGKVPITGTAAWLSPTGQAERTWQLRSMNVTAASDELKVGSAAAEFKSSILGKLASSLPWSFM